MPIRRVALIFDNTLRPDTTGTYCRRALGQLVEVEHFVPGELGRLRHERFDLYLAIDDGLNYAIPGDLHPSAYWAIDTHLDFDRELRRARAFDLVFAAQRDGAARLRQAGVEGACWLPLACDPEIHARQPVTKDYDVAFVGNVFAGPREDLLRMIQEHFPNNFIGRRYFGEMARVFSQSRIVFNRSLRNDVNMRVFEGLAAGSLLVTNDLRENGQEELFQSGVHLATYADGAELLERIRFYLEQPELREWIAERGREEVLSRHTYRHRMVALLEMAERSLTARESIAIGAVGWVEPREAHRKGVSTCKHHQQAVNQRALPLPAVRRSRGGGRASIEVPTPIPILSPGTESCEVHREIDGAEGLTSIVIVTHNQLEYTRLCLDSIRLRTAEPYELIAVDNASSDGTLDYLRQNDVRLIANSENRGFPAGANQGILAGRGDAILLLNNDTVVTTGWLRRLRRALYRDAGVGLVGPCTNCVSGSQQIAVDYTELKGIDGFAWDWGQRHDGQWVPTDRLVGFCLLFRRGVVGRIGLLDERFGIGNFEDDDFCRRANADGFRCEIAIDAFVHHFGHATFHGAGVNLGRLLEENRRLYEEKWRVDGAGNLKASPSRKSEGVTRGDGACTPERVLAVEGDNRPPPTSSPCLPLSLSPCLASPDPPRPPLAKGGSTGAKSEIRNPNSEIQLSLCMIVRDNEPTIGACLESIRPFVDEMVVVDTGSKDRTPEICRRLGARLFEFHWGDDFSAARNESLRHARGEWIFWMDSDDTISEECGGRLRELAQVPHPDNVFGYIMQVHCPGPEENGQRDVTVVDHVKLIRNRPDLRFQGRIHEQLLPAIRRAGGDVAWTDIYVVHSGSDHSPEGWQRKLERDLRILNLELAESAEHPFVLFNLGMTYADAKRWDEAIGHLRRCIAVSQHEESHLRKAYALLVSSLYQAERVEEAWTVCQEGRAIYPDDKELIFRCAMLHHHSGRLAEAEAAYLAVLNGHEQRHFTSIDRELAGNKARHNLAIVYDDMGRLDCAEEQWRLIVQHDPLYAPGWRGLGETLLKQGKDGELGALIERIVAMPRLRSTGQLLGARLCGARGDYARARSALETAIAESPADVDPLQELCRLTFEQGAPEEAETAIKRLIGLRPEDPAAWHNLGTVQCRLGRLDDAAAAYRRSLELRPSHEPTIKQLQYVRQVFEPDSNAAVDFSAVTSQHADVSQAIPGLR